MTAVWVIAKRELKAVFSNASTGVFLAGYALLSGYLMMENGAFFLRAAADMRSFFTFQPLLLMVLMPALTMRTFSDEYRTGTMELLTTLPFSVRDLVVGKFLAACLTAFVAAVLTVPAWVTVNKLGFPDNGTIFTGYVFLFLTACAYAAVGVFFSVCTTHQTAAFMCSVVVCAILTFGAGAADDFLPKSAAFVLSAVSFQPRFDTICAGLVGLDDIVFYVSEIIFFLFAAGSVLELKKGKA